MAYSKKRGDTLIEVILAFVFLAVIIIGAVTIMNRGKHLVITATENTEVRMHMSGQFELLRYLRNEYLRDDSNTTWIQIVTEAEPAAFAGGSSCNGASPQVTSGKQAFYIEPNLSGSITPTYHTPAAPEAVASPGEGMWIEATRSASSPAFVDFQIAACWPGISNIDSREIKNTMRLYDPSR